MAFDGGVRGVLNGAGLSSLVGRTPPGCASRGVCITSIAVASGSILAKVVTVRFPRKTE